MNTEKNIIVIGICGGIATGKSSLAKKCQKSLNCPVFHADMATYKAYQNSDIISKIAQIIPSDDIENGQINKQVISKLITRDQTLLHRIEGIIHPFVKQEARAFITENISKNVPLVIFEIPLMFTSNMDKLCDYIIALDCPKKVSKERALRRRNMTDEKFGFIYKQQQAERMICRRKANLFLTSDDFYGNYKRTLRICNKIMNNDPKFAALHNKQQKQRGY